VKTDIESRTLVGRVTAVDDAGVTFDRDGGAEQVPWSHLGRGKVQVEFNRAGEG
jgi:hypothetical protein